MPNGLLSLFQPDDYISLFSLRSWAKLRSDILTTEIVGVYCTIQWSLLTFALGIYPREGLYRGRPPRHHRQRQYQRAITTRRP